jgi:hypothetical protein
MAVLAAVSADESMLHKLGYETVVREDGDAALSLLAGPNGSGIDLHRPRSLHAQISTGSACWHGPTARRGRGRAHLLAIGNYHGRLSEVARRLSTLYRKLEALEPRGVGAKRNGDRTRCSQATAAENRVGRPQIGRRLGDMLGRVG